MIKGSCSQLAKPTSAEKVFECLGLQGSRILRLKVFLQSFGVIHARKSRRHLVSAWMFVDAEFPPDEKSLWGGSSSQQWCYEKLEWLRPHQLHPTPCGLFDMDALPGTCTVRQGYLPDCYLISAIALLAQQSHLLRRLFVTYEPEEGWDGHSPQCCDMLGRSMHFELS